MPSNPVVVDVDGPSDSTLPYVVQTGPNAYSLSLWDPLDDQIPYAGESAAIVRAFDILDAATGSTDTLSGYFTVSGSSAFTNSGLDAFSGLATGQSDPFMVTLSTSLAGPFSETLTLHATGTRTDGTTYDLDPIVLTVATNVLSPQIKLAPFLVEQRPGDVYVHTQVTNRGPDTIVYKFSGEETDIHPGQAGSITVDLSSYVALGMLLPGAYSATIDLPTVSNSGVHGDVQATLTGVVLWPPTLKISLPGTLIFHAGDTIPVTVTNTAPNDGYSENMKVAYSSGLFGPGLTVTGSDALDLAPGQSGILHLTVAASGPLLASGLLGLSYQGDPSAFTSGTGFSVQNAPAARGLAYAYYSAVVMNYASPKFSLTPLDHALTQTGANSYTLDLGQTAAGQDAVTNLSLTNAAQNHVGSYSNNFADLLSGNFTVSGDTTAFDNGTLGPFSGLAGDNSSPYALSITLKAGAMGTFSETITLHPTSSDSSYSGALPDVTLTITGQVLSLDHDFTLPTTVATFHAGPGLNVFTAAPGTILAGDIIDGGPDGTAVLHLTGAGDFDLGLPGVFSGFATVTALSGQSVHLRSGGHLEVDVSAPLGARTDSSAPGAVIYGSDDADTIRLGPNADTIYVGSNNETVLGGAGDYSIWICADTSGAAIDGGTGFNTSLYLAGGGTLALGDNITNIDTVYLTKPSDGSTIPPWNVTLNSMEHVRLIDQNSGGDTIAAGGLYQTLIGQGRATTQIGFSGGHTVFQGNVELLAGTTIVGFDAPGDYIRVGGVSLHGVPQFVEAADHTHGTLTVHDIHGVGYDITLIGDFDPARFHVMTDTALDIYYGDWHGF